MSSNKNSDDKELNLLAEVFKTEFTNNLNSENKKKLTELKALIKIGDLYKVEGIANDKEANGAMVNIKEINLVRSRLNGDLSKSSLALKTIVTDYEEKLTAYLKKKIQEGGSSFLMIRDFHPLFGKIVQDYLTRVQRDKKSMSNILLGIK